MLLKSDSLLLILIVFCLYGTSCQTGDGDNDTSPVLAEVFDHKLTLNDLPEDITLNSSENDREALINAYADHWVRKMLLLHEAEKRVPETLNIEKLVQDYKQSLLINNLEKQVIDEELDTIIETREMELVYEQVKENYIQDFPIIRLNYIKIPEDAPRIDKFYEWWKNDQFSRMDPYVEKYASSAILGKDDWWEWNEIQNQIDPDILSRYNFKKARNIQKNIGEYEFFINIYEFVDKSELAPLSFIEDQIRNIIIQRRKVTVMDEYLERIYQNEVSNKNILLHSS